MRVVLQRVSEASVTIEKTIVANINQGLVILLGIESDDTQDDVSWLATKVSRLRIFSDENGLMNKSVKDVNGDIILVSQFTLFASTKKGNRPGFTRSAKPVIAIPLYESFIKQLESDLEKSIQTGEFGADMKIALVNDGPVTITIDSKNKE
ncbi:MAG: D-tyrosyl-tRNA(Tyr) deacylase [Flavobacteriaceae bacterium]|nr:D-tyrosyl-tRNA(Tyr) deacylase [Flavobacteriaceae bacterium]